MNLENQVCSIELAKQLKELGILQQSLFWWIKRRDYPDKSENLVFGMPHFVYRDELNGLNYNSPIWENTGWEFYAAFTVSELNEIIFQKNNQNLEENGHLEITTEMVYRSGGDFYRLTNNLTAHIVDNLNEADALAKLLIILGELYGE